ncbi:hypothetical protein ACIRQF_00160 [Streptomyces sp. NPDC101191]|uniref:hypothetical protein n=1 Tax=Streptomyces sp. NPDC101191 TaxID=3366126 RepID=UPI0037FB5C40
MTGPASSWRRPAPHPTYQLAAPSNIDRWAAGKLRYLARRVATHTERLAHTPPSDLAQQPLGATAKGQEPYTTIEEITADEACGGAAVRTRWDLALAGGGAADLGYGAPSIWCVA